MSEKERKRKEKNVNYIVVQFKMPRLFALFFIHLFLFVFNNKTHMNNTDEPFPDVRMNYETKKNVLAAR